MAVHGIGGLVALETWVVHVQHVQWQLLNSYQAIPSFLNDQTYCVGTENVESKSRQH